ncbi:PREDICTED: saccharopine dehydrogenase-like oxidoreductase [Acromyrmex echinatior]|uniref:Putative saccharopine dehydrogenase n=1 Tax=Acromyrmex echinatior TaxID=103372 RepID=F4X176_ACREC|nr:PREDICTED: saccharopine dehydrogenase-like oxidoreductase [Acromyrmex echinatior]EGI59812.1 Putative saccharopine dehydrogenase [Acromyrmex echinatior]
MANDRLDMVIFAATGHTGKYVVKNAIHVCKDQKMKFGIAGRRKEALDAIVKEFASDIADVPVILADVKNEKSLKKMTERAKILVNCCGPYRFYGEPVIKTCIATRTHYVDVAFEEQFMIEMELKYNEAAKEAGIYIVSACGLDCIPSELGVIFTQQKFEGEMNAIEIYMSMWLSPTEKIGPICNYGTWQTFVHNLAHIKELLALRKKLYPIKLPEFVPKLKSRLLHRSDVSEGWSLPFPSIDRSVVLRTQRFLYEKYKERPAQVQFYVTLKYFFEILILAIIGMFMFVLSCTACGRNLLLKYPTLFSFGIISSNPELLKPTYFSVTFNASGWTEKLAGPIDKHRDPPNKKVVTRMSSDSPGYELTSIAMILSAVTILNETDKIPDNGGVLTPGAAFGKTSLIEKLIKHNIKFEVISSTEK